MSRAREAANWIATGVTSTELDKLDGFTGTVDDLNYAKDLRATGVTATEFDQLDTTSGTPGSSNYLRGDKTWATITMPTTGISDGNTLVANANVADDDFLRVDGTSIEGRTAAETLGDIGAAPLASPTFTGNVALGSNATGTFNGTIGSSATFPAGRVLQQKTAFYTATTSFTGTSAISQIAVTITNLTAGSDVLILASISASASSGTRYGFYTSKSGTTAFTGNIADSASSRPRMSVSAAGPGGNNLSSHTFFNLDESVSAGSSTYTVVGFVEGSETCKINRSDSDGDSATVPRGVSSITVLEIAQ